MAALRWAALNLWSSHDTARDDPPAATTDDESRETSASESDDSVTRSLPPLEAPTTLDGAAFRPPTEPNVGDAAGAWDLHDEPECPVCLEPAIPPLLGGPAGRLPLDDVQLATLRVALLTIGQLARQTAVVKRALPTD